MLYPALPSTFSGHTPPPTPPPIHPSTPGAGRWGNDPGIATEGRGRAGGGLLNSGPLDLLELMMLQNVQMNQLFLSGQVAAALNQGLSWTHPQVRCLGVGVDYQSCPPAATEVGKHLGFPLS